MNSFILDYDPTNINAFVTRDAQIEDTVRNWYEQVPPNDHDEDLVIVVGCELFLEAARVLVKEQVIDPSVLRLRFQGIDYMVGLDGRLRGQWPAGFCDTRDNFMERILGW